MEMLRSMSQAGYSKGQLMTSRPGSGLPMSHAPLDPSMQPPPETTPAAAHVGAETDPKPSPAVPAGPLLASPTSAAEEPNEGFVAALGTDALQLPSLSTEAQQQQQEQQQRPAIVDIPLAAAALAPADSSQPRREDAQTLEAAPDVAAFEIQDVAAAWSAEAAAPSIAQPVGEQETWEAAVAAQQAAQVAPAATAQTETVIAPGQEEGVVTQQGMQPGAQAEADVPDVLQPAMRGSMAPDGGLPVLTAPKEAEAPAAAGLAPAELAAAADDAAVAAEPSQPEMCKAPAQAEGDEAVPQEAALQKTAPQEPAPGAMPIQGAGTAGGAPEQMTSPAEGGGTPAEVEPQLSAEAAAAAPLVVAALEEPLAQSVAMASLSEELHEPTAAQLQPTHHADMGEPAPMATELSTAPPADKGIPVIPERSTQGIRSLADPPAEEGLNRQSLQKVISGNAMPGGDQVEAEEIRGATRDADSLAEAAPESGHP